MAYQWGTLRLKRQRYPGGVRHGSDKKLKGGIKERMKKANGFTERVAEAAEGRGRFRICLIDHKGAHI